MALPFNLPQGMFQALAGIPRESLMALVSSLPQYQAPLYPVMDPSMSIRDIVRSQSGPELRSQFYARPGTGYTEEDIGSMSGSQLINLARRGFVDYIPNPQTQRGMFESQMAMQPTPQYQVYTPMGGYGTGMFAPNQTGSALPMLPFVSSLPY